LLVIKGYKNCVIKNIIFRPRGDCTKNLILKHVAIVKGFYINIISKEKLKAAST
jgi:hypothetical protein